MDYIDFLIAKAVVLVALAFLYGVWEALSGR